MSDCGLCLLPHLLWNKQEPLDYTVVLSPPEVFTKNKGHTGLLKIHLGLPVIFSRTTTKTKNLGKLSHLELVYESQLASSQSTETGRTYPGTSWDPAASSAGSPRTWRPIPPGDPAPGRLSQSRRGQAVGAGRTGPKPRALKAESGATGPEPPVSAALQALRTYAQLWLPQVSTVVYGQGASGTGTGGRGSHSGT